MKKLVVLCATCGVGKSTIIECLNSNTKTESFVFYDVDELGLNWHDYKDLEDSNIKFAKDVLKVANSREERRI